MKILLVGESSILPTAAGEIVRTLFGGLLKKYPKKYEVEQLGLQHTFGVEQPKWPIHPAKLGSDGLSITYHSQVCKFHEIVLHLMPDIIFVIGPPHIFAEVSSSFDFERSKLVFYLKPQGFPISANLRACLDHADAVITMSHWCKAQLLAKSKVTCAEKVRVIYPVADSSKFKAATTKEKVVLRTDMFPECLPGSGFLLGWVGRNRWRSQIWVVYKLLHYLRSGEYFVCSNCGGITLCELQPIANSAVKLNESRPNSGAHECQHCSAKDIREAEPLLDLFLWMHVALDDPHGAWPLHWLEHQYSVTRGRDLYYTEGYSFQSGLTPQDMPQLYQLWDCLLYPGGGGGSGLTVLEAMNCELPVIYTNHDSHAEFLNDANAGIPVPGILQPEAVTNYWRMVADLPSLVGAVRALYYDDQLRRDLGVNGGRFGMRHNVEGFIEAWDGLFAAVCNSATNQKGTGQAAPFNGANNRGI
jgi:glycosyltransferase involved in cell wall biosynthesis